MMIRCVKPFGNIGRLGSINGSCLLDPVRLKAPLGVLRLGMRSMHMRKQCSILPTLHAASTSTATTRSLNQNLHPNVFFKTLTAVSRMSSSPFVRTYSTKNSDEFKPSERAALAQEVDLRSQLSNGNQNTKDFAKLFELAKSERYALAGALLLLLISAGLGLCLPFVIGKILDAVNDPSPEKTVFGLPLPKFLMVMVGVFLFGSVATYYRVVVMRTIGERMVTKLRSRAFRSMVKADAEFFDANTVGDLISRLGTDANVVSKSVTQNFADGFRSLLTAGMGIGMMCYMSVKLTAVVMLCLPPMMIGTWLYGRKLRVISRRFQDSIGDMTKVSEERLNNVSTARAFNGETQEIRLYHQRLRDVFAVAMQEARASGLYFGMIQLTGNYIVIGLLSIGAYMVSDGALSFGELSSFIMYAAYSGSAIAGMATFYSELMKGSGAAQRLFEIEDRKSYVPLTVGEQLVTPKGDIEFHNVTFSYPTRPSVNIFKSMNLKIKAGSNVCIVGQSGGGKSTVLSLLLRFYDPTNGYITIGNQDISKVSAWDLRKHIGVVSQEPSLFSGTIAENILYANPKASREDVLRAAQQANCSFIRDFPDGIDTKVGNRGAQLSGGQKQRIAIARAIIKKPAILVMDEATSALDGESEMLVNAALAKLINSNSTTISVAHRLSTIARSKEVIVLGSEGYVIEHGDFADLYSDPNSELSKLLLKRQDGSDIPTTKTSKRSAAEEEIEAELMNN
ncbi:ATP-binding cassette permease [Starmerella bacillaris]|uniref:ATP-binding cassette permease n=1 Tax=Starmerella bacillaris TaxID=1247836 RepID=A0AAV5RIN0_STABA|nr:ATP-binding cassette permease [Starmerella bacillaris]